MSRDFEMEARGTAISLGLTTALTRKTQFNRMEVSCFESYISFDFFAKKRQETDLFTEIKEEKPEFYFMWDLDHLPYMKEIMKRYKAWKVDQTIDLNFSLGERNTDSLFWLTTNEKSIFLVSSDLYGNGLEKMEIDKEYENEFIDKFLKLED